MINYCLIINGADRRPVSCHLSGTKASEREELNHLAKHIICFATRTNWTSLRMSVCKRTRGTHIGGTKITLYFAK